jgi:hypothetical protein
MKELRVRGCTISTCSLEAGARARQPLAKRETAPKPTLHARKLGLNFGVAEKARSGSRFQRVYCLLGNLASFTYLAGDD